MQHDYVNLYKTWIGNPKWWFSSTRDDDIEISNTFGYLLSDDTWKQIRFEDQDIYFWLGVIICNDQIVRHVNRVSKEQIAIRDVVSISHTILNKLIPHSKYLSNIDLVFVLLPLRHTRIPLEIFYAATCAFKYLDDIPNNPIMNRFIKATFNRVNHDDFNAYIDIYKPSKHAYTVDFSMYSNVLDENVNLMNNLCNACTYSSDFVLNKNIIISLSGGVDSMVCLHMIKHLPHVFVVHINYMNRNECMDEERFVVEWCNMNNITCFVRRINEIRRRNCMDHGLRDVYERYTQDVRFATYKFAQSCIKNDLECIVVLGHNKDDVFENIITNMQSNNKFDNLAGMEKISTIRGHTIYRPLLDTDKKTIFDYAHKYGIPYLKDTTPPWSRRAKIRSELRDVFDRHSLIDGMFEFTSMLTDATKTIDYFTTSVFQSITEQKFTCDNTHPLVTSAVFASKLFRMVEPSTHISRKSIINFHNKVQCLIKQNDSQIIVLHKTFKVRVSCNDGKINIKFVM